MQVGADQVWQLKPEGQAAGQEQTGRAVGKLVVTMDLDVNGEWEVVDASDPDQTIFQLPESMFERFVRHVGNYTKITDPQDQDE